MKYKNWLPALVASFMLSVIVSSCVNDKVFPPDVEPTTCDTSDTNNTVTDPCDTIVSTYAAKTNPIIQAKCATPSCHVTAFAYGDFTGYNGVKAKVDDGSFESRVFDVKNMPPQSSPQLTAEELQIIQCWLDKGAQNN